MSKIDESTYQYESSFNIVKGCEFSTVGTLYIENLEDHSSKFGNYADGSFSHNMEWMTYESVKFIHSKDNPDEAVSGILLVFFLLNLVNTFLNFDKRTSHSLCISVPRFHTDQMMSLQL